MANDDKKKSKQNKELVDKKNKDNGSDDKSNKPETSEVERFVMPFTKWVEGKLHKSPVVNPTKDQIVKNSNGRKAKQVGLRAVIKQALKIYPGTVLSADKTKDNGVLRYKIKIISAEGVVKIVTVPTAIPNGK